ncbi:L,D-transpeptidase family protein [Phycisphaerales bacterium AB-hyl4]|uniref:L,D-transpeptidase family protein n=1 Tax=Natronomicrosphaera hydrolytica TaxID=3242702 RepID=A0ABV4U7E0_9BACT
MALSSQSSRSGMRRHYSSGGGRRRSSRRWLVVFAVVLLVGGSFWLFRGGGDDADLGETASQPIADADASRDADGNADREPAAVNEQPTRNAPAPSLATAGRTPRIADMNPVAEVPTTATRERTTEASREPETPRSANEQPRQAERRTEPNTSSNTATRERATATNTGTPTIESSEIRRGMDMIADGDYIEGRRVLSAILFDDRRRLSRSDARAIRETLASVNDRLVFSPEVASGDPIAEQYNVQSGDLLARIARRYKLTYPFLEQINRIDARRLQVGQSIKLIRGPFHARVSKSEFRMDVYVQQSDGSPIYIRSFDVGLGEDDSTPEGMWVIEPGRKVVNPDWRNPRTGEYFRADDPKNPIGDFWLALDGIDGNTADRRGYGIHGTIEPDSIGQQASMGCIRLRDGDIEQIFHMLVEGESTVEVVR